jgi:Xaa-Pro aminopeptidase
MAAAPARSEGRSPDRIGRLLNRERGAEIMRRAGLDGLLVTMPLNVYYLSNAVPVLSRFSATHTAVGILPADTSRPIAYVTGGFEYYAGASDSDLAPGVTPYLVGGSLGGTDPHASPAFEFAGNYAFDAREQRRRAMLEKAAPFHASLNDAVYKALRDLGLNRGAIGVDGATARALLEHAAPKAKARMADDLLLHVRLVKTPAELALMRQASANNVGAALTTAAAARQEGGIWRVRQRFFAECARRGNTPVYASVDLVMSELADGAFREGQAFMIDFVSHYAFYQGDYGRTVFYGEPDAAVKHAAEVGAVAWEEIRSRLRPGLRFSEIRRIGNEAVKKQGERYTYAFNPHTVGLQHWDQPIHAIDGAPIDHVLEPGMVLSVDCPMLNAGVDGTTHIEDLTLITDSGAVCLHQLSPATVQV